MRFRPALLDLGNAGAAENARRSLDEWVRAQVEVAALVARLNGEPQRHGGAPGAPASPRVEDAGAA
jgi:hypothetical protein